VDDNGKLVEGSDIPWPWACFKLLRRMTIVAAREE
jgi:hypothetical protein